jgi:hypothetical protein
MQLDEIELLEIKTALVKKGVGSKGKLAAYMKVAPPNVTRYLKYGDIPEKRLKQIKKFINNKNK